MTSSSHIPQRRSLARWRSGALIRQCVLFSVASMVCGVACLAVAVGGLAALAFEWRVAIVLILLAVPLAGLAKLLDRLKMRAIQGRTVGDLAHEDDEPERSGVELARRDLVALRRPHDRGQAAIVVQRKPTDSGTVSRIQTAPQPSPSVERTPSETERGAVTAADLHRVTASGPTDQGGGHELGQAPTTPSAMDANERMSVQTVVKKLLMPACLLLGAFVWAFSHTIGRLWEVWQNNPDYSVGQLVPLAALYMLWTRRRDLAGVTLAPSLVGVVVFACGVAASVFGGYFLYSSVENVGMVLCVNGLALAMVGWKSYRRICIPLLFLFLMLPLPGRIHDAVTLPLQTFCARVSAIVLETVGVPVQRYGHVLEVSGHKAAVAEACNGLRMALAFLIVTSVVAYLIHRPKWQKVVVLISSVPIALTCNVVRIVAMTYLYSAGYGRFVEGPLHDGVGFLMMPLALSLVFLELALLSNLAVSPVRDAPTDSVGRVSVFSGR